MRLRCVIPVPVSLSIPLAVSIDTQSMANHPESMIQPSETLGDSCNRDDIAIVIAENKKRKRVVFIRGVGRRSKYRVAHFYKMMYSCVVNVGNIKQER